MGVWVTEPTCVGVRKHIWRVSCGPGVFGNSLQSTASVDFIIFDCKMWKHLKSAHLYTPEARGGNTLRNQTQTTTPQQMANPPRLHVTLGQMFARVVISDHSIS